MGLSLKNKIYCTVTIHAKSVHSYMSLQLGSSFVNIQAVGYLWPLSGSPPDGGSSDEYESWNNRSSNWWSKHQHKGLPPTGPCPWNTKVMSPLLLWQSMPDHTPVKMDLTPILAMVPNEQRWCKVCLLEYTDHVTINDLQPPDYAMACVRD
jgi:hypothetical protein